MLPEDSSIYGGAGLAHASRVVGSLSSPLILALAAAVGSFPSMARHLNSSSFFLPAQSSDWPCDSAVDLGQCLTICAGPFLVCLQLRKGVGYSCATDDPVRFVTIYIYFYYGHNLF